MDNSYNQKLLVENLEISNKMICDHIKQLEKSYTAVKKEKTLSIQKNRARRLLDEIDSIKGELGIFEIDLCNATEKQRAVFFSKFTEYENQCRSMETEIQKLVKQQSAVMDEGNIPQGGYSKNDMKQTQVFDMERNDLVKHVDAKIKEADVDLDDIVKDLVQSRNIMEEINVEIRRQQEKLSKIQEEIQETYSLSKRAKKLVNYFRRQILTDKILWAFLVLIIAAIISIIVLQALGYRKDSFDDNLLIYITTPTDSSTTG